MSLRTFRERMMQTFAFEIGGLCIVAPLYARLFNASAGETMTIVIALSLATVVWSPLHNTAYDWVELTLYGRVASDRPQRLRLLHATSHEISVMVLTLPLLMTVGGHSLAEAVVIDLGFSVVYIAYAYFFHILYDCLRPVAPIRAG